MNLKSKHKMELNRFSKSQSEGSERITQILGCDDCTGLGYVNVCVSVVVVLPGANIPNVVLDSGSLLHQKINV